MFWNNNGFNVFTMVVYNTGLKQLVYVHARHWFISTQLHFHNSFNSMASAVPMVTIPKTLAGRSTWRIGPNKCTRMH